VTARSWPRPPRSLIAEHYHSGAWRPSTAIADIERHIAAFPDKSAVIGWRREAASSDVVTFAALDRAANQAADALAKAGVTARDVISVQLPNWWQLAALYIGCLRLDAVIHPIPPIQREREVEQSLRLARSRHLVVPRNFGKHAYVAAARTVRERLSVDLRVLSVDHDIDSKWLHLEAPHDETTAPAPRQQTAPDPDNVTQLIFTSGTTGEPRGVLHTHNTLWAAIRPIPRMLGLTQHDRVLVPSTMAHQTGFLYGLSLPLMFGMTGVYQDTWDPAVFVDLVRHHEVSLVSGSAAFAMDSCDEMERQQLSTPSLRTFRTGGAPIPDSLVARVRRFMGAQLLASWGMTENGICAMSRPTEADTLIAASDGAALPGVHLRVVASDGTLQPPGLEGALHVRTPSLAIGYLHREREFAEKLGSDGWFETGDRGYLTSDGHLRITGRDKDIIIRGGENVPVAEVENALYVLPDVKHVAVVAVPDERLGERACAVIVTKSGQPVSIEDVKTHLAALGMAIQYWPEFVLAASTMPMTPAGKVRKDILRELARVEVTRIRSEGTDLGATRR
jgi:cyclohexanecarboxylate-CoA ligase